MSKYNLDIRYGIILSKAKLTHNKLATVCKLAVDTGASFTMISIETALSIAIDPSRAQRHIEITTANGVIFAPLIKIASFECLGVEIKELEVICHNLPPESCVEGLLGINFLQAAKITIDFSKNIISTP
ncbi:MAG: retropepsin-like aspartic protease [Candidatus Omnitrophota bacterium]